MLSGWPRCQRGDDVVEIMMHEVMRNPNLHVIWLYNSNIIGAQHVELSDNSACHANVFMVKNIGALIDIWRSS